MSELMILNDNEGESHLKIVKKEKGILYSEHSIQIGRKKKKEGSKKEKRTKNCKFWFVGAFIDILCM